MNNKHEVVKMFLLHSNTELKYILNVQDLHTSMKSCIINTKRCFYGFFLLRLDQIKGDNCLSIFKKMGYGAEYTDFAMLLGGKNREWWTMTPKNYGPVAIQGDHYSTCRASWNTSVGVRPAIKYSTISHFCKNGKQNVSGVTEVEFGEYPCSVDEENDLLFKAYYDKKMILTDKNYKIVNPMVGYEPATHITSYPVYEYNGKKYIKIESAQSQQGNHFTNGNKVKGENRYFLRIEPIVWLVDEEADLAVTKNIVFAGVMFNAWSGYFEYDEFEKSFMKKFLNKTFAEDIKTPEMHIFEEEHSSHKKL